MEVVCTLLFLSLTIPLDLQLIKSLFKQRVKKSIENYCLLGAVIKLLSCSLKSSLRNRKKLVMDIDTTLSLCSDTYTLGDLGIYMHFSPVWQEMRNREFWHLLHKHEGGIISRSFLKKRRERQSDCRTSCGYKNQEAITTVMDGLDPGFQAWTCNSESKGSGRGGREKIKVNM